MARAAGNTLPHVLLELLSGRDLPGRMGQAILITTTDPQGWPHPALLSFGEVVAVDPRHLRLAAYRTSGTSGNLRRSGKLTLCFIDAGMAYYVKTVAEQQQDPMEGFAQLTRFEATVEAVLMDQAREDLESEARLTGGITFRLGGSVEETLRGWQAVVDGLRGEI